MICFPCGLNMTGTLQAFRQSRGVLLMTMVEAFWVMGGSDPRSLPCSVHWQQESQAFIGSKSQRRSLAARGKGVHWQQESQAFIGSKSQRRSLAARVKGVHWQQESKAFIGSKSQRCSLAARVKGVHWQQESKVPALRHSGHIRR